MTNEVTHLLLNKEEQSTDISNTTNSLENDRMKISTKKNSWLEKSLHEVFVSQRSMNDIKRHELLAGNVGIAAYLIRDAVLGDDYAVEDPVDGAYNPFSSSNTKNVLRNEISIICRKCCSSWTTLRLLHYSVAVLLLLTFFEPPHWCRNYQLSIMSPDDQQPTIVFGSCDTILRLSDTPKLETTTSNMTESNIVEYYPNTTTAVWLTISQSHMFEIIIVSIITIILALRVGRDGCSLAIYLRRSAGFVTQSNRICQILCTFALFLGVYLEHRTYDKRFTMLHPYIRLILYYTFLGGTQRDIQVLLGMLPVRQSVLSISM
jgi:hypothetical protein